jgi:hypothetical protein
MPTEIRWTVLQLTTLLLLALATAAFAQEMWFLLVLAVGALLPSTFYTHRYVNEHLGGGRHPRHGDHMD